MQREIPYVVRPKDNLLEVIKPYIILAAYFSKPVIWTVLHGSRTKLTLEDWEVALKLLFLAYFRSRAVEIKSDEIINLLNRIFDGEPYQQTIFDQWWTLEKAVGIQKVYDVEEYTLPDEIKKFSKTGNPDVDLYIDSLLQEPDDDDE